MVQDWWLLHFRFHRIQLAGTFFIAWRNFAGGFKVLVGLREETEVLVRDGKLKMAAITVWR